ncbi:hypothetical protein ACHYQT_000539 [Campylobacter jejuni]|uniref:Periplasmic protein n=1 Tax=Campylobacter jejuni TaxID=197 RepID=A0A5Z5AA87_CAMJU|nr:MULTISPECIES: hypothetical protein [Campylobacter]EAB5237143.1 hypothetical protein [Campylobacter jejuni]EAB5263550.1 hypothetical protein [Campylobacter jejuni]EAB5284851.1 hypothetical protein [Campylobacter jejuni]EAB5318041.1 hypothetical protein [Campylobacter jejuni]EAH4525161.1 hypothetical protein [Campylobacter jejuni]
MKKLGLALAVLVALNVSAFADLIVINKKDLVPVSASEMQNKYFQESIKTIIDEPLFKKATFYEADIVAKVDPKTYKVNQSMIKDYYSDKSKYVYYKTVLILTSDGKRARLSTLTCDVSSFDKKGYFCGGTAEHNYSIK